jgi:hypothetical protein
MREIFHFPIEEHFRSGEVGATVTDARNFAQFVKALKMSMTIDRPSPNLLVFRM